MAIKLATADLNYLLQQVNILNDYTQLTSPIDPNGVREVSGSNNNLVGGFQVDPATGNLLWTGGYDPDTGLTAGDNVNGDWGQADTDFLRLFQTDHPDAATDPSLAYGVTFSYQGVTLVPLADAQGNPVVNPAWTGTTNGQPDADGNPYLNPAWQPTFSSTMGDAQTVITGEGTAFGTSPRTITQLISSSDVDPSSPTFNPAAYDVMNRLGGEPVDVANTVVGTGQTAFIPNPGVLGGVTYNEFFVAFGQFFDHGLDFINKNGGYVLIPLSPNDPLYDANKPAEANVMMLSRASLSNPQEDFEVDANGNLVLKDGVAPSFNNNTGLMIDQSQTYGSHESHNVLVRQYDVDGKVTGRLIDGSEDGVLIRTDADGVIVKIDLVAQTARVLESNPRDANYLSEIGDYTPALDFTTQPGSVEWPAGSGNYTDGTHELASWTDMQANAARIGIGLIDADVLDIPRIKADAIGRLMTPDVVAELNAINDAQGLPPLNPTAGFTPQQDYLFRSNMSIADIDAEIAAMPGGTVTINGTAYGSYEDIKQFDPFHRDANGNVLTSNQPVLIDIAYGANPENTDYNAALLGMHKVSGDGRVNENFGLTAVHHVFHEEHNIQSNEIVLAAIRDAATTNDLAGLNGDGAGTEGWLLTPLTEAQEAALAALDVNDAAAVQSFADGLSWDGEKLYQAARIITESEYNHIAIDQYMGALYPLLPEFVAYSADINLSVSLEFSQAVFRLGHSQLVEQIKLATPYALDADGNQVPLGTPGSTAYYPGDPGYVPHEQAFTQEDLFTAFLNPVGYEQYGAASIVSGLLNQQGNEMDEFVTSALQQSLVGIPLDLAALNIARARDVGLPTLNELRQQAFDGLMANANNNSNGSGIAPYTSWTDFGGSIRNPESLVNFIAAYGQDDGSTGKDWGINEARAAYEAGTGTLQDIRAAAQTLLDAYNNVPGTSLADHEAAVQFMEGGGRPTFDPDNPNAINGWVYTGGAGDLGFWDIDLWIGGLAEQPLFDGPLGTTFSLILLDFTQRMQDGDRFYYLFRQPVGHHLGDQIIGEQFHDLIMRTTDLENIGDAFGTMTAAYYLDGQTDANGTPGLIAADGTQTGVLLDTNIPGNLVDDGDNSVHDYFNAIYATLPDVTRNLVVANKSFEVDSTAPGDPGVSSDATGSWNANTLTGWEFVNGGVYNPDASAADEAGIDGSQVAYIANNGYIEQDLGAAAVEGATYQVSFRLGNRIDLPSSSVIASLIAVDSAGEETVLATTSAIQLTDGWKDVVFDTTFQGAYGPVDAAVAGQTLRVRIEKLNDSTITDEDGQEGPTQVLIDNVTVRETTPGGSANDGHLLIVGGTGNDFIKGGLGDDYIYGNADDDIIEGAQGNDHLYGGDGDDWITDYENDDFIHGGAGNDYIAAGPGVLDTAHGGAGNDEVHGGDGIDQVFGGDGDDILFGEGDTDLMEGGDGNDYIDGGDSVDEIFAGNGNDWIRGGVGDDHMNGGSGNDLMEGGGGPVANDGDRYFGDQLLGAVPLPLIEFNGDGTIGNMDIASYENLLTGVTASLNTQNATGTNSNLLDQYAAVDGIVGSATDDLLEGGSLTPVASNGWNNQLIGGGGSDRLTGLGDDAGVVTNAEVDTNPDHYIDWLFGDAVITRNDLWADLEATLYYANNRADIEAGIITSHTLSTGETMTFLPDWGAKDIGIAASRTTTGEMRVLFEDGAGNQDVGHILGEDGVAAGDIDTAVYRGNRADYTIKAFDLNGVEIADPAAVNAPAVAYVQVVDNRVGGEGDETDGIDRLVAIERLEFADTTISIATPQEIATAIDANPAINPGADQPATGVLDIAGYTDGGDRATLTAINTLTDPNLVDPAENPTGAVTTYRWQELVGATWQDNGETNQDQVVEGGGTWRVAATYTDAFGTHTIVSPKTAVVGSLGNDAALASRTTDDFILGLDGNDTITWDVGDGTDFVDGGAGTDTLQVNGDAQDETFFIETATEFQNRTGTAPTAGTEIVISRAVGVQPGRAPGAVPTGIGSAVIVAELTNINEIVISGGAGASDYYIKGDFSPTTLLTNTITIEGSTGDDVIDISGLASEHRIVFRSNGGNDKLLGTLRPQDVVELAPGSNPADYSPPVDNGDGTSTISNGTHSITFATGSAPQLAATEAEDHEHGREEEHEDASGAESHEERHDDASHTSSDVSDAGATRTVITGDAGIDGESADDLLVGDNGANVLSGGQGDDNVVAGNGDDLLFGGEGDDRLLGEAGNDRLFADAGDDQVWGGDGNDDITGGAGDDYVNAGAGDDIVRAERGDGDDIYIGGTGRDLYDLSATTADAIVDLGAGTASSEQTGEDHLSGFENVAGGFGNDRITADNAHNVLTGGAGDDSFIFPTAAAADGDRITDFSPGDRIDLHEIAATALGEGNRFQLLESGAFDAAGQVQFHTQGEGEDAITLIQGNLDADAEAEFTLTLEGRYQLKIDDQGIITA